MLETHIADVLVVGGEGAALRAAIEAHDTGARTMIVCKGRIGKSGSTQIAGADITIDGNSAAQIGLPGNERDSKEKLMHDILIQGYYLNNQKLVEAYVRDAPARTKELIEWGMKYVWDGNRTVLSQGTEIDRVLIDQVHRRGIQVLEDVLVTDLLTCESKVVGALAVDINQGAFIVMRARAVVAATGGWQRGYPFTTAPEGLTGDLHAAAYRAGARLVNMEMVTFCPNVILWPPSLRGDIFPYILIEMFGDLLDKHGRPFLKEEYDQRIYRIATTTEWNKLIFSQASNRIIERGDGSPQGGVYYSLKTVPWNIVEEAGRRVYPGWKWIRTDYSDLMSWLKEGNAVEVGVAAHYMEGGILVDEHAATSLKGLYAAGECSGGLFGANRVSSAITQVLVQGRVAGASAGAYSKVARMLQPSHDLLREIESRLERPFQGTAGLRPIELKRKIQRIAGEHLWIVRNGDGLKEAVGEIQTLANRELPRVTVQTKVRAYNKEWIDFMQVESLLVVLEACARSALTRTESRGVHYRSDYPKTNNDRWLKEIVVEQVNRKMATNTRPITVTRTRPPRGKFSFEEGILKAAKALGE